MKTLATIVVEVNWENKYFHHGDPDMESAIREHLEKSTSDLLGYEWDLEEDVAYIEGKFKIIKIDPINIVAPRIKELPFCEHCGENHTEFGCEFDVDGTSWCLNCYLSDKLNSEHLYDYYGELEKKAHIKYLEKKLKKLKDEQKSRNS